MLAVNLDPVFLSFKVAFVSTILVTLTGTIAAWVMHRYRPPGRILAEALFSLPLVLPPTVVGFALLVLLGKHGVLGGLLEKTFHFRLVFTWQAAVVASSVMAFPLFYQSFKAALATVDHNLELAASTLGASTFRIFITITLPLAWPGFLAGVILAFARSLGEFGATLMLAGNIPGQTQTMPLAIYLATEAGDMNTAWFLVAVITLISFGVTYGFQRWSQRNYRYLLQRGDVNAGSSHK